MSEADATAGLYGVHVLHEDMDGFRLIVNLNDGATGAYLIESLGSLVVDLSELRSIAAKLLALCDRLDAAEGKTPTDPTTELLYRTEDMHGRVLAEGDRSDEWRVTSLEVKSGRIVLHTAGGHYVSQSTAYPVEVVR